MSQQKTFRDLRIVFMGTPEFAVASLDMLVDNGCNIVGVVTAPDKPGGRGMEMQQSAVKKYALQHNLKVLQPEKLKAPEFIQELKMLAADLQVVVAFRMLPEIVWNMPPLGSLNLHGSLLPQYRGAAPINWAVINGEKETGVTTFKLQHEIDTGDILLQEHLPIGDHDTAGTIHDQMMKLGAEVLLKTVRGLADGSLKETPQKFVSPTNEGLLLHAPKIFTETCALNFAHSTERNYNLVRGLSPFPAAFTELEGKKLKIFSADKMVGLPVKSPGEYDTDKKTYLRFACSDGYLDIKELQLEGKKRMGIEEFLRGYRFKE
jgi:methionyl-tRNA formyltransferase